MAIIWLILGVTLSWLLTRAARRYAIDNAVLDVPNRRSSHTTPTPRGGGIAIAAMVLMGVLVGQLTGTVDRDLGVGLLGGGALVSLVGWVDDHGGLGAAWRALAHLLASVWAVIWVGGMPRVDLGIGELELGAVGGVVAVVGIMWAINLFNFMDGIDGIAAGEAVSISAIGGVLLWFSGAGELAFVTLLVGTACTGFLWWNWQPAKIFMGDVGSYLLGYALAVIAVASETRSAVPLAAWIILGGVFVFDATATLLRRVIRGEQWYGAHRSHAYQRAVQAGWSHAAVTGAVLVINAALAILAIAVMRFGGWAIPGGILTAGVLLALGYLAVERVKPMEA